MNKTFYKLVLITTMIIFSSYCSANKIRMSKDAVKHLPKQAKLNVERILQRDNYSCATTSLAMLMSYQDQKNIRYNKNIVWDKSKSSITKVRKNGNDIKGLKRVARSYGFKKYKFVTGLSVNELKYLITQDIPVLINIRNYFNKGSHAVVVIGYNETGFFINDPSNRNHMDGYLIDYKTFKKKWWANLSSPRGKARRSAFILYKNK